MTWFDLAVGATVAAALILVPGLALALVARLRGLAAWAAAGPFGIAVLSVAALVAPAIGLAWSVIPLAIVTGLFAALILLGRRWLGPGSAQRADGPNPGWWTIGALALAGLIITVQLVWVIRSPEAISQTFDNIFHLNAVRYALDNDNASPLFVGSMTSTSGGMWFYPTAWHALASLVVEITGIPIAVAANALSFVLSAVVWPAGSIWLATIIAGRTPAVAVSSAIASAGLAAFPMLMLEYGVLYPLHMGLAVLPAAIACALYAFGFVSSITSQGVWVICMLGTIPALAISHPGALVGWLAIVSVAVVVSAVAAWRRRRSRGARVRIAFLTGAYAIAATGVWWVLRPPAAARTWLPEMTVSQAIGEVLAASPYGAPIALVLSVLLVVGMVSAVQSRSRIGYFAVGALAAIGGLYVVVAGVPYIALRDFLTGSWYNNLPRVAAILPAVMVPLIAWGADRVWSTRQARDLRAAVPGSALRVTAASALILALVAATQVPMRAAMVSAHATYALSDDSPLVSEDEMELLERVPDEVPADAAIAGSPWTGTAAAYALADRRVLQPHTLMDVSRDVSLINDELNRAAPGSAVCGAISRTGTEFVLDFGTREIHGGNQPYPGFRNLARSTAVELVDSEGDARLYRIVGCDR